jgi:phenylacetate-coenzyme A ligase PaaK-like adenylate-forming protein
VRPADIRSAADLVRLPVSSKADLRERPVGDLLARGVRADRLILRYTAGSTGEPTRVRRTEFETICSRCSGSAPSASWAAEWATGVSA